MPVELSVISSDFRRTLRRVKRISRRGTSANNEVLRNALTVQGAEILNRLPTAFAERFGVKSSNPFAGFDLTANIELIIFFRRLTLRFFDPTGKTNSLLNYLILKALDNPVVHRRVGSAIFRSYRRQLIR